jgi:hypothetical protein
MRLPCRDARLIVLTISYYEMHIIGNPAIGRRIGEEVRGAIITRSVFC